MTIKECDRCGRLIRDSDDELMQRIEISKGPSFSDLMFNQDLCPDCIKGLFNFLKPLERPVND